MKEPSRTTSAEPRTDTDAVLASTQLGGRPTGEPVFAPPDHEGEVGRLGRYRVLKKLGHGGMGAVYLGYDAALNRKIALKVMLPQFAADRTARQRFLREARTAAMVNSDHVVTIFDVGEEDGVPFIAMEYLLGYPLDRYLKTKGELPLGQALRVIRETAMGLSAAHELGLIHRDIKPANLWLEAPKGRVKILDFGLARTTTAAEAHLTGSGAVLGTPAYMSPEQGRGQQTDARGDLFSLGVVMYRLCTGKMPFTGPTVMAVLTSLGMDTPVPPRQHKPELPEALEAIITKLLAKAPADRFQSSGELLAALADAERRAAGPLPVFVPVPALQIGAQTQSVWEGIDDSASVPVPLRDDDGTGAVSSGKRERLPARKLPNWPLVLTGFGFLAACAVLAAVLLWPRDGTLVVESEDPEAELVVRQNGRVVRDRTKEREFVLPSGAYAIELADPKPGLRLSAERVEVPHKGTVRARVFTERPRPVPPPVVATAPEKHPDRKAAEYVLDAGGRVQVAGIDRALTTRDELPPDRFTLTVVNLASCRVTELGLETLAKCDGVTFLNLGDTDVTPAELTNFKNFTKLEHLILRGTEPTDRGLEHFKQSADLSQLDLADTPTGDAGLAHFKDCTKLVTVDLSRTKVTDAGLSALKKSTELTTLLLAGTPLTDAGLNGLLGFKKLTYLNVRRTAVTRAKVEAFRYAQPQCRIEYDEDELAPLVTSDADRKAALYVLSIGGKMRVNGTTEVKAAADLPAQFELTAVDLSYNTKLVDGELAVFADCTNLRELTFAKTVPSETGLGHFKNCRKLEKLSLSNAPLTPAALEPFAGCAGLKVLSLNNCLITDAALAHFRNCPKLKELFLPNNALITDAGLKHFENCKELTWLAVGSAGVTDAGMAYFKGCSQLTHFDLTGTKVTDKGLENFKGNTVAVRLNFSGLKEVTNVGLANFRGCTQMQVLWLNQTQVTDPGLDNFEGCTSLVDVSLSGLKITDAGLANFKGSKKVSNLVLTDTLIGDMGLENFAGSVRLTGLYLTGTRVTDAGLRSFQNCRSITHLDLGGTKVSDAGLENFKGSKKVKFLFLSNTRVEGPGLDNFRECPDLVELRLDGTPATDAALQGVARFRSLTSLHLQRTGVGDTGVAFLTDCKALEKLYLRDTKLTTAGLGTLKSLLPKCNIDENVKPSVPKKK